MGTIPGPVVGTLALYIVPQWLNRQQSLKDYSFLVYGMLLLLLVIFLPEGIVGGVKRLWYRVFGRVIAGSAGEDTGWASPGASSGDVALAYLGAQPAASGEPAIATEGIYKKFGDIAALQDVNLSVKPGTIHAVIGPNGSGKTTLLNVISGFYRQDRGTVRTFGRTIRKGRSAGAIRVGIARTFQTPQMLYALTGLENVMLGCHARGRVSMIEGMLPLPHVWRERKRFEQRARACIQLVGLGQAAAATPVGALPFAHQRLLEVARALAGEPSVLLLDEPASGLHPDEVRQFATLIRRLRDAGLTIVLVEHNFALVGDLSDMITVLDAGSLIAEGNVDAVRNDPAVVEAYLGA
jgi:ABC-type branched-subunit amino acid transport system ATPase component